MEYNKNADRFFRGNEDAENQQEFKIQPRTEEDKAMNDVNMESNLYKRNEAKFFGEKEESRKSSRGSVYQQNAAHFFGYETPEHGDRPFEPPSYQASQAPLRKPVFAQNRVLMLI